MKQERGLLGNRSRFASLPCVSRLYWHLGIMLAGGVSADLPSGFERTGRSKAGSTAVRGAGGGWLGGTRLACERRHVGVQHLSWGPR